MKPLPNDVKEAMRGKHCLRVTSEKTYIFERIGRDELLEKGGEYADKDDIDSMRTYYVNSTRGWLLGQRKNVKLWRVIHSESEVLKEHIRNDK